MKRIFAGFAFAAAVAAAFAASKLEPQAASYRFEPEAAQPLAGYGAPSRDPKLEVRASGAVYLLAVTGGHGGSSLGLAVSHDGGDSFAPPIPINNADGRVSSHGENSPTYSFGVGTDVYALWEQSTGEGLGSELLFARSGDFGRNWAEPIAVTDKAEASTNAFSSFTVAPNGQIYAVWLDGRDRGKGAAGTSSVYLAKSTDGGRTFGKNMPVAHNICPCCRPTVAADAKGVVHVSWRHVFPGNIRDIVVATSTDGGETFEEPVRAAEDNWKIDGCPHAGASMLLEGERLWISWYSAGDGSNPGVRVASSDDGGRTFSPAVLASGEVLDANHPTLAAADDGRLLLVFQGRDPQQAAGWAPSRPWLVEIDAAGNASAPLAVPGRQKSISYPVVASAGLGRVLVAWSESGEHGQQVRLIRGRRAPGAQE